MKQALQGPKQRKAFRGKSWQLIIAVAALFITLTANSQNIPARSKLQPINATGYEWQTGSFKKGVYIVSDTLPTTDTGVIVLFENILYQKTPWNWSKVVKVKQLTDSSFSMNGDTITIRGGSGGGGANLSNTGSGFRLVKTPSGQIKSIVPGYGLTGDSTTNTDAITVRVKPENLYGSIYAKGSWTDLNDFEANGAIASVSSGKILLSTSFPGLYTQTLDLKGYTCLEHWRVLVQYTLKEAPGATTHGLGIGVRSTNTHITAGVLGYADLSTDGTDGGHALHAVDFPLYQVVTRSSETIAKNNDDRFETIVERAGNKIMISARNLTTNSAVADTFYDYNTDGSTPYLLPNTGKFSLFAVGGQIEIDSISIFSKAMKGADLLVASDSKFAYGASYLDGYANQLRSSFSGVVINAGPGDRPVDIYNRVGEIMALHPKQVLLECGTNEDDSNVTKYYIQHINDTLIAQGIRVIHTAFFQTGSDQSWRYNYLLRTFPNVIDCYNPLTQPNTISVADNIHPSTYGHQVITSTILSSNKLLYGSPYSQAKTGSINNSTILQSSANYNIDGIGKANILLGNKMGIGLNNPTYSITLNRSGVNILGNWYNNAQIANAAGTAGINLGYDNVTNDGIVGTQGVNGGLQFWTRYGLLSDFSPRVVITPDGKVGFGTMSPTRKLTIDSSGVPDLSFSRSGVEKSVFGISRAPNVGINGSAADDLFIRTSGGSVLLSANDGVSKHLEIKNSGTVAIYNIDSTSTPRNILYQDANGDIKKAAVPSSGGITSINSQTGSSQTIAAGTGIDVTTTTNTITVSKKISDQVHTSGTSVTISAGVTRLFVDPASALASLDITMPSSPSDGQVLEIFFGGTISGGSLDVVTGGIGSWSASGGGFVPSPPVSATPIKAGTFIKFQYRASNTMWYQMK